MANKIQYSQLEDNPEDVAQVPKPPKRRQTWLPILGSFFFGLLTMGLMMAVIVMPSLPRPRQIPHSHNGTDPILNIPLAWSNGDCGNSPEEARERECTYNIVLQAWLPRLCHSEADAEDAEEMYRDRSWVFKTESGQNLTMEQLSAGEFEYARTSMDFHITHCMYVWKRLHRVILDPTQELDSYTASYGHTNHCVKMIGGQADEMHDITTTTFVKYPKCAK